MGFRVLGFRGWSIRGFMVKEYSLGGRAMGLDKFSCLGFRVQDLGFRV